MSMSCTIDSFHFEAASIREGVKDVSGKPSLVCGTYAGVSAIVITYPFCRLADELNLLVTDRPRYLYIVRGFSVRKITVRK